MKSSWLMASRGWCFKVRTSLKRGNKGNGERTATSVTVSASDVHRHLVICAKGLSATLTRHRTQIVWRKKRLGHTSQED